jgi:hypothetical protein
MRSITILAVLAGAALAGCSSIDGAQVTLDRFGPVAPDNDSATSKLGTAEPLYFIFDAKATAAYDAAKATTYVPANDAAAAKAFLIAGADLIKQNCDDYFDSSGKIERRLLFGRDVTTLAGALATTAAAASHATAPVVTGIALATTSALSANDTFRSELTFGAQYTDSVHQMVLNNLQTMYAAQKAKDLTNYTYGLAIADLRDLQDVCMPAEIVTHVKSAITGGQFAAIDVSQPGTTLPGQQGPQPVGQQGPAPAPADQAKAGAAKTALMALFPSDARVQALVPDLNKIQAGQSIAPTAPTVPADHRIKLVPLNPGG